MKKHTAPIIAAVLLLLLPYLGSYFLLVQPGRYRVTYQNTAYGKRMYVRGYRFDGDVDSTLARVAPVVFWPLEQLDRQLRRGEWEPQ